jgi:Tfp pilus assembly protein PilO
MKFGLREIIFIVLLTALPLGAWWLIFRPHNAAEAQMLKQITAKQDRLRELNHTTGTIGDLKREIEDLQKAVAFFQSKLPSEKEIDKVLQEVWNLAEANQLTTKSIRTADKPGDTFASPSGPHAEQMIQMTLEGDFRGFYGFLLALENQPRIMRIRKMKMVTPDKASPGYVQVTFEMSIFFERADKDSLCLATK